MTSGYLTYYQATDSQRSTKTGLGSFLKLLYITNIESM